jgi:hypothetical protein
MKAHICNPSTQEAEAGKSQVSGQPGLHSENQSGKKKKKKSWALMAHPCNPRYSGGRNQEASSLKPAWANML